MATSIYPKNFLWGSATAAHQVEGGTDNDWSEWEKTASHTLSMLPDSNANLKYISQEIQNLKKDPKNLISGRSSDHYNLYKQDIDILKSLNQNAYRFSIEWSRVEPKKGEFNMVAINHYKDVVKYLKANGIEPIVTLWHFTNPKWIRDMGGWTNPETIDHFLEYTKQIVECFGKDVEYWVTINEPEIYAADGFLYGVKYPGVKSFKTYNKVIGNLLKAHRKAYKIIKDNDDSCKVSIAKHFTYFRLREKHTLKDLFLYKFLDWFQNYRILNNILNYCDFIGVNFYHTLEVGSSEDVQEILKLSNRVFMDNSKGYSDLGWSLFPGNIYYVLKTLNKYKKPILITENGIADAKDVHRKSFLAEVFKALEKSLDEGVNLIGYLHWSLLDNFEWSEGYGPKFGLVEVNYVSLERKLRDSAIFYSEYIQSNKEK